MSKADIKVCLDRGGSNWSRGMGLRLRAFAFVIIAVLPASASVARAAGGDKSLDAKLTEYLDSAYAAQLRLSPQRMTVEGLKEDYGKLDDYTPAADKRKLILLEAQVKKMKRRFRRDRLGPQARMSYDLFERSYEEALEEERWRGARFTFTALRAPTTSIPSFLVNNQKIESRADAEAYISRLNEIERVMNEVSAAYREKVERGVIEPQFIFGPAIAAAQRIIRGAPFEDGPDSVLWDDFKTKLSGIGIDAADKDELLSKAFSALRGPVQRGYDLVIAELEYASPKAASNDGVWRLPDGEDYYAWALRRSTTTGLSAEELHEIGLQELEKAKSEMEAVAKSLGSTGTLRGLLAEIRSDPKFRYPNTDEGRVQYLAGAKAVLAEVEQKAPEYFASLPSAPLEVRAVEEWRAATAPVAFYADGSPDGVRPGIYYVNLRDMTQVLKPQVTGITCHEAAPGHHFQSVYANRSVGLPVFRRRASYGAYGEGWGLYSEQLCKEMGVYKDDYSTFSRLSGDARRAARLVVDTGINAKHWTREEALVFLKENTVLSDADAESEVNRYLTEPGQATSYMMGRRKIVDLREKTAAALCASFDLGEFHDLVLSSGSLPLEMLETLVDDYIAAASKTSSPCDGEAANRREPL